MSIDDLSKIQGMLHPAASSVKEESNKFDEINFLLSKENHFVLEIEKNITAKKDGQVLIECDSSNNMDIISSLIKVLLDSALTPAIILTSSNYKSVISFLEESKINSSQVILIDTVSKAISRVSDKENIYFLDSLRNLTQIQIKLVNLLKSKKNVCFIFDSLNVLELYHSDDVLMKFIYSSTKILHKYGANGYYIINSIKILPKIAQSFDNIFKLEKVE